jgi:hypothetical protein
MKNSIVVALVFIILTANTWSVAQAIDSTSQNVAFSVQAVNEIAVAGDFNITNVKTAMVNFQSIKVINAVSTYLITTNEENKKITGVLNTILPKDSSLSISLEAPTGAISVGSVDLKNVPADLVTRVSKVAEADKVITYTFSAPVSTQLTTPFSQIVTLTITN